MKYLITFILTIGFAFSGFASDSKSESIRELLKVAGTREMMDSMRQHTVTITEAHFRAQPSPYKDHPYYDRIVKRVMKKFDAKLRSDASWEKWEPFITDLYGDVFSERQIKGLIVFYSSETGQASLRAFPQIMTAVQVHWNKTADTSAEIFDAMISDSIHELEKEIETEK